MAIRFIQEKKKQKYLMIVLVVMVLIIVLVLWQGKNLQNFANIIPQPSTQDLNIEQYREITINFDVLKKEELKNLVPFEEIAPFEGETGRENPFLPQEN
jgi:cell division protein YceG involved in septum cleavage